MSPTMAGIAGLILLFVLIFSKMPVGFLMMLLGISGFAYLVSPDAALNLTAKDLLDVFGSYNLTVIPLFILMGQIAFHSGISSRLFKVAYTFIGHWPGGMAVATLGACTGFSAICGSTNATAATMAAVTLPEMKRYNYHDSLATGVVAAGGSLGILIPPSVVFIIYGIMTEQSIGKLFIAGIIPGIFLTVLFILAVVIWSTLRPDLAPRGPRTTLQAKMKSLAGLLETLALFAMVMGGLFFRIFYAHRSRRHWRHGHPDHCGDSAQSRLPRICRGALRDHTHFLHGAGHRGRRHHFRPFFGDYPDSL